LVTFRNPSAAAIIAIQKAGPLCPALPFEGLSPRRFPSVASLVFAFTIFARARVSKYIYYIYLYLGSLKVRIYADLRV